MANSVEAFGKYLLLERLAAGGMAEVYLSKSVGAGGIGKFVAIKRILPQYSDKEEFINMFKEEAKLVMNLNHGNIVSIFDFGIEKSQFFLVMEFVEGQNLRQILNHMKKIGKYFSLDQIVHVAKEVASGLDHAHRCIDASTGRLLNITHRDMSPQNIMVSFEGEVKVVDFGIAKAETQLENTRSGTIKGKFGYMSPEQAEGQIVDARTDIFSLGIVLWELLAQDRLFTAQNEHAVLKKIKECQIPPIRKLNPAVHPDLEKILLKALTRDRNLRYQTAEAFSKDLNKYLNTHFPDFSKQEFSKFMKQIYHDMYLDYRKKLAEYAQIEIEFDKTEISTNTASNTGVTISRVAHEPGHDHLEMPEVLSQKVDLSKLVATDGSNSKINLLKRRNPLVEAEAQAAKLRANNANSVSSMGMHSQTGYNVGTNTKIRKPPTRSSRSGPSSTFIFLAIISILCAGYYFWDSQKHQKDLSWGPDGQPGKSGQYGISLKNPPPPPKPVPLNIQSTPSGAKVLLNDQLIGVTPLIWRVDTGKPFKLALYHEGYLPQEYDTELADAEGYNRSVTMMPETPTGTLNIFTNSPIGSKTIVIINGQRVAYSIPYTAKVAAGTPVTVTLVNPYSKTEGSQTIVIRQNEKVNMNIPINKPATIQE